MVVLVVVDYIVVVVDMNHSHKLVVGPVLVDVDYIVVEDEDVDNRLVVVVHSVDFVHKLKKDDHLMDCSHSFHMSEIVRWR